MRSQYKLFVLLLLLGVGALVWAEDLGLERNLWWFSDTVDGTGEVIDVTGGDHRLIKTLSVRNASIAAGEQVLVKVSINSFEAASITVGTTNVFVLDPCCEDGANWALNAIPIKARYVGFKSLSGTPAVTAAAVW